MTPSMLRMMLGISLCVSLYSAHAAADERAMAAAPAPPISPEQQLHAAFDERLRARVDTLIEREVDPVIQAHATDLLKQALATRESDSGPVPAQRAFTDDRGTKEVQRAGNTACKMVGRTLECVLRDRESRSR